MREVYWSGGRVGDRQIGQLPTVNCAPFLLSEYCLCRLKKGSRRSGWYCTGSGNSTDGQGRHGWNLWPQVLVKALKQDEAN